MPFRPSLDPVPRCLRYLCSFHVVMAIRWAEIAQGLGSPPTNLARVNPAETFMLWGIARRRLLSSTTTFAFSDTVYLRCRGSAIARIAFQGRSLSALINDTHENPKYLPGIQLGHNVVAEPDLLKSIKDATALVFVLPHQFLPPVLNAIRGHVSHLTRAVSLIKGVEVEGAKISTFPTVISSELGIPCSALSGANIANEGELFLDISLCTACFLARPHDLVAEDKFCESTLGVPPAPMTTPPDEDAQLHAFSESQLWHRLFQTNTFRIRVVQDVEGVCLCGGLKSMYWDRKVCRHEDDSPDRSVLRRLCGTGLSGRNRLIAEMMVKTGKVRLIFARLFNSVPITPWAWQGFRELEEEKLNGQKLQGPQTAQDLHAFLTARGDNVRRPGGYPLLEHKLAIRSLPRLHHVVTIYKKLLILAFDGFLSTTFLRTRRPTICTMAKEKVCLIGSGNWGSSIARIAAMNVKDHPDVFVGPHPLNIRRDNDVRSRREAEPDLIKTIKGATALIVVVPHQFLEKVLDGVKEHLAPGARAVSLIKVADGGKIYTYPRIISSLLGIRCSTLGGANIAIGVAKDEFCESTLGVLPEGMKSHGEDSLSDADLWYKLFNRPTFRIRVVPDVDGVALCGGLKNVIALAAGFSDGLGWGSNTKSAIIRIGIMEIKDFCVHFFPEVKAETFLEESISGRNRKVAEDMVKTGKGFQQLEKEELGGQSLQGPQTAEQLHNFLEARSDEVRRSGGFPLIENVWKICYQGSNVVEYSTVGYSTRCYYGLVFSSTYRNEMNRSIQKFLSAHRLFINLSVEVSQ
ncbi:glycerol-3-phosphate dehydrogenase (NAD+) [Rhizoctonia solani AG-1 IA]|uniref:Glycerol-3-phosphate dehydrogenase [NAD(+)] n=1 Tax=Thanatephorus cucumeris (strain AG1-IA) TaxID=983506 RepID=L8X2D5_THACA|nr:glycerol-3-phosphate dehydrogenase (NAD+) [Rhizoctonia solani AG-1 IA]